MNRSGVLQALALLLALAGTAGAVLPTKEIVRVISFGHYGRGIGEFYYPVGIVLTTKNEIWVSDWKNNRVSKHDIFGKYLAPLNPKGEAFSGPVGIAIGHEGDLYVVEHRSHRARKYNAAGDEVWSVGGYGSGQQRFNQPRGVACDSKGHVFVADYENARIQELAPDGSYVKSYVFRPAEGERPAKPRGVAVDSQDRVWAVYTTANKIARFNDFGNCTFSFGTGGNERGALEHPRYLCFDVRDFIYVTDFKNHRVQKFSQEGDFVYSYGSKGNGRGQFHRPEGVAVDAAGNIYVADQNNYRVQILQVNDLIRHCNLGFYFFHRQKDVDAAMEHYERALKVDPACKEALDTLEKIYTTKGDRLYGQGKYLDAHKYFRRIAAYHPSNIPVQKRLRSIMWHTNKGRAGYLVVALGIVAAMGFLVHLMVKVLRSG